MHPPRHHTNRPHFASASPGPQADLLASLGARVDLLLEEALRSADGETGAQGGEVAAPPRHPLLCGAAELAREGGCDVALPRRVLLPWLVSEWVAQQSTRAEAEAACTPPVQVCAACGVRHPAVYGSSGTHAGC